MISIVEGQIHSGFSLYQLRACLLISTSSQVQEQHKPGQVLRSKNNINLDVTCLCFEIKRKTWLQSATLEAPTFYVDRVDIAGSTKVPSSSSFSLSALAWSIFLSKKMDDAQEHVGSCYAHFGLCKDHLTSKDPCTTKDYFEQKLPKLWGKISSCHPI